MTTPLFVTRDSVLLEELSRLAAAAGVTPAVVGEAGAALGGWATAPMVCVGTDLAEDLAALQPSRRDAAYVIANGPVAHEVFVQALDLGAEGVLELPRAESWLIETLTDVGDSRPSRGLLLGVVGGSGGSGASMLACALGQVAARHGTALVVDTDPLGPGLDLLLGLDAVPGARWDSLQRTTGRLSARSLRDAVPRRGSLGVLTWPMGERGSLQAFAVRSAVSAAQRGYDHVVIDLPRVADRLMGEVAARCDEVELVVLPTLSGVAAAARLAERLCERTRLRLVVRGRGVAPSEISSVTGVDAIVSMPSQRGLDEAIDVGLGPIRMKRGPLYRAATEILEAMHQPSVAA